MVTATMTYFDNKLTAHSLQLMSPACNDRYVDDRRNSICLVIENLAVYRVTVCDRRYPSGIVRIAICVQYIYVCHLCCSVFVMIFCIYLSI